MKPSNLLLSTVLALLCLKGNAQDERSWSIHGYLKYMQSNFVADFPGVGNTLLTDNLWHNRLNFQWYSGKKTELNIELRNRLFYGEYTKLIPNYGQLLGIDAAYFDLSSTLLNRNNLILHSTVDRAYFTYQNSRYLFRIGRQRINWGISTVWNPNDVFNAFNFFDFDYEERPGADAIRFQYYTGTLSSLEIAAAPADSNQLIVAGKYQTNLGSYDLQAIASWYKEDLMLGAGFAGNLKLAGLKGEMSYFRPRANIMDSTGVFTATFTLDYSFKNGWYTSVAGLITSAGSNTNGNLGAIGSANLLNNDISIKRLMPSKFTALLMVNRALNHATSFNFTAMYGFGINMLILFPTITYGIKENWDIDLVTQASFVEEQSNFQHGGSAIFFRLKRSF